MKQWNDFTDAEKIAFQRNISHPPPVIPNPGKHVDTMTAEEFAAYERALGIRPTHGELARRRRVADARRDGR